jgi:hypothetical protein
MKKGRECRSPALFLVLFENLLLDARYRLELEIDHSYACRDIEAGVALDTERLKRNRSIHPADQQVAADAESYGRASSRTAVVAGEQTGWGRDLYSRR